MPEPYRGRRLPPGLPVSIRRFLGEVDKGLRAVTERGEGGTITSRIYAPTSPGSLPPITITEAPSEGEITLGSGYSQSRFLPGSDKFPLVAVKGGNKFHLLEPYRQGPIAYARDYGAKPNTGQDMTSKVQKAFDKAPIGSTLVFEPGEWVLNGALTLSRQMTVEFNGHWVLQDMIQITASNVEIRLMAGCYIEKDPNGTVIEPFWFNNGVPSAWDNLTADPAENDVTITVTTPGNFQPGDWIKIKDATAFYPGGSGTHWETNQVRSILGSVLTLEFPLSDSYSTVLGVPPSASVYTPVVGSGLTGPGKVSNGSATDASIGNAGVRFSHAVAGYVRGVEFFQCQQEGIRYFDSFCGEITDNYCHQMSNVQIGGVGSGRGITVSRSTHTLISDNRISRTRHAIDISDFSRHILAANNVAFACLFSAYQTHPDVKHVLWTGNIVTGVKGFVANGGAEWGTTYGTAFNIRENNQHIHIVGNQITDCDSSGIAMSSDLTSDVLVRGNVFKRCNLRLATVVDGAILLVQGTPTATPGTGIIVEDNLIEDTPGRGIVIGCSGAVVRRNTIRRTTAVGTTVALYVRPYTSSGTPAAIDNIEVTDNDIETSGSFGIYVGDVVAATTNVRVEGNRIKDCVNAGIYAVPAQVDELTIKGNRIRNCNTANVFGQGGIMVGVQGVADVQSTNLIIEGNHIWDCSQAAIMCAVSGARIERNRVYDTTGGGGPISIYLPRGALGQVNDRTTVAYNTVVNGGNCIYIGDAAGAGTVTNTIIKGNVTIGGSRGIRLLAAAISPILIDNICTGASTNNFQDDGATTPRIISHYDMPNYRVGIGTTAPARILDVFDAANPQIRLTHTVGSWYSDLQTVSNTGGDTTFGGLCLLPAVNPSGYRSINLFGTAPANALAVFEDGSNLWFRTEMARDMKWNLPSGHLYEWDVAFDTLLILAGPSGITGAANFKVPTAYSVNDASTNTILQVLQLDRTTTTNGAAGIGVRMGWNLDDSAGTKVSASEWDVVFDTATAGATDASIRVKVKKAGSLVEALRLGAVEAVFNEGSVDLDFRVESNGDANCFFVDGGADKVGIGTNSPSAKLHVSNDSTAAFRVNGASGIPLLVDTTNQIVVLQNTHPAADDTYDLGDPAGTHWLSVHSKIVDVANSAGTAGILSISCDYVPATPTGYAVFGAGSDARIGYDGTDLRINTAVVGSGVLRLDNSSNWSTSTVGAAFPAIPNMPSGTGTFKWLKLKDDSGTVHWVPSAS